MMKKLHSISFPFKQCAIIFIFKNKNKVIYMLYEDEDDFFVGSPRSKFFDIMFNANKNLVEDALEKHVERHVAVEMLLNKFIEEKGLHLEAEISTIRAEKQDEIHHAKIDFFIATVGDILTQNE
jgi:hypothetical protein